MIEINKNFLWHKLRKNLLGSKTNYENLRNKKILITGGTGFIGSWIVHGLSIINTNHNLNITLILLVKSKEKINRFKFLDKFINIEYILGDITKFKLINKDITHLIHAAGVYKATKSEIRKVIENGAENILKIIRKNKINNLIFLSSGAVYENNNSNKRLKENDKLNHDTKNYYSYAKKNSENLFKNYYSENSKTFNLTILRLFSFAGPGVTALSFLAYSNFIKKRLQHHDIKIDFYANSIRSFMHPIDMTNWIIRSINLKNYNILNVGGENKHKLKDLAEMIANTKFSNLKTTNVEVTSKKQIKSVYIPSLNLAYKKGFKLSFGLRESIIDSLKHKKITNNEYKYYFKITKK